MPTYTYAYSPDSKSGMIAEKHTNATKPDQMWVVRPGGAVASEHCPGSWPVRVEADPGHVQVRECSPSAPCVNGTSPLYVDGSPQKSAFEHVHPNPLSVRIRS
eukprot:518799-Prorocentrum_minimum.AAC.1